jgi:catechol-2,3-dioxygenase
MNIQFQSSVLLVDDFEKMKSFYQDTLQLPIVLDFGTCITFKNGLTIWKLMPGYPISQ